MQETQKKNGRGGKVAQNREGRVAGGESKGVGATKKV